MLETRISKLPSQPSALASSEHEPCSTLAAGATLSADACTPPEKVASLRAVMRDATKSPPFTEGLERFYLEPSYLSGDEVSALARKDMEIWS